MGADGFDRSDRRPVVLELVHDDVVISRRTVPAWVARVDKYRSGDVTFEIVRAGGPIATPGSSRPVFRLHGEPVQDEPMPAFRAWAARFAR